MIVRRLGVLAVLLFLFLFLFAHVHDAGYDEDDTFETLPMRRQTVIVLPTLVIKRNLGSVKHIGIKRKLPTPNAAALVREAPPEQAPSEIISEVGTDTAGQQVGAQASVAVEDEPIPTYAVMTAAQRKEREKTLAKHFPYGRWRIHRLNGANATCLDGSPASIYVERHRASKSWMIFFAGGGWCHHPETCKNRARGGKLSSLGTSTDLKTEEDDNFQAEGWLTWENATTRYWNKVWFPYCDGSSYLGNVDGTINIGGRDMYMRGHKSLEQAFVELNEKFFLGEGDRVFVAGHSAGGMAVLLNLKLIRRMVPRHMPMQALMDAGLFMDVQELGGGRQESERFKTAFSDLWNATHAVDPQCVADRTPTNDEWRCLIPEFVVQKYVPKEVPLFISQVKYDTHPMKVFGGVSTPSQKAHPNVILLGKKTVDIVQRSQASAYFIPACGPSFYTHTSFMANSCHQYHIGNITLCQAVNEWLDSKGQRSVRLIEPCEHPCNGGKHGEQCVVGHNPTIREK